jgi:hypothetical protein
MPTQKDEPKQKQPARSPKPGAGETDSTDIIADEAERLKSSTSRDRAKRRHVQSTERQKPESKPKE